MDVLNILVVVAALVLLMLVAYRGFSVIIFAPLIAMGAVLCFEPLSVFPSYVSIFMDGASGFVRKYFPMFLLGAIFGKVIELSGFSRAIVANIFKIVGAKHAIIAIVLVTSLLSYGGVSAFVLVFAVYPFAAELFRMGQIPKRLIPGVIWLGGITYAMDALPGSPQIQNIIPTTTFDTNVYSAPILGIIGSIFILVLGVIYFEWARRKAAAKGEGYDSGQLLLNEPEAFKDEKLPSLWIALIPLIVVGVVNFLMNMHIVDIFGSKYILDMPGMKEGKTVIVDVAANKSLYAVEIALMAGVFSALLLAFKPIVTRFAEGSKTAVSGCLLAIMNTSSEVGYGAVIAMLPGFVFLANAMEGIGNPLISEVISISTLAGIVGSASGGLSIAMETMGTIFVNAAKAAGIPMEVAHRVASMASGAFDSLPHNGAVITLLAVTGLTHRQAYGPIFVITLIKTAAVFFVIAVYYTTGLV